MSCALVLWYVGRVCDVGRTADCSVFCAELGGGGGGGCVGTWCLNLTTVSALCHFHSGTGIGVAIKRQVVPSLLWSGLLM